MQVYHSHGQQSSVILKVAVNSHEAAFWIGVDLNLRLVAFINKKLHEVLIDNIFIYAL